MRDIEKHKDNISMCIYIFEKIKSQGYEDMCIHGRNSSLVDKVRYDVEEQ